MWQTGGGAKQSTRRGGPVLLKTRKQNMSERSRSVCSSSCMMLRTNGSKNLKTSLFCSLEKQFYLKIRELHIHSTGTQFKVRVNIYEKK